MSDDHIIAVVQAHKEGKKIQGKNRLLSNVWVDLPEQINWDFMEKEYRVAPEPRKPRELWLIEDKSDRTSVFSVPKFAAYPSRQLGCDSNEQIHVREVIEPHRDQRTWWAEFPSDGSIGRIFTNLTQHTKGGALVRVMEVLD